jgi:hypothetical protein
LKLPQSQVKQCEKCNVLNVESSSVVRLDTVSYRDLSEPLCITLKLLCLIISPQKRRLSKQHVTLSASIGRSLLD